MEVRNGKELGPNLVKIAKRLLNNQNLCKLLIYTDLTPLAHNNIVDTKVLLGKNIRVKPKVLPTENIESRLVLLFTDGTLNKENTEVKKLVLKIFIYVPIEEWDIDDEDGNLRPFMIMSEIMTSLYGKQIIGLGKIKGGDFSLDLITDEMSTYIMEFEFDVFN